MRWPRTMIALFSLLGAAVVWWPFFADLASAGPSDWQNISHMWEAGRVAVSRYGEFPLWDPWHCGGITLWGNPQNQVFSPLFWLSFPLGTTLALKLFVLLHCAAGFAGMFVLARREFSLSVLPAVLAAGAWGASGPFIWHLEVGHATFAAFWLVPWALLFWRRAARDSRFAAAVALVLLAMLLDAGTFALPLTFLLLLVDAIGRWSTRAERAGIVRAAILTAGLFTLVGAIRIVPTLLSLARYPRQLADFDALDLSEIVGMFTTRDQPIAWAGHEWGWWEYGAYMGWPVIGLMLLGAVAAWRDPRRRPWVWAALVFLACMMGNHGACYPWPALKNLPVFASLRVPSRFNFLFALVAALLAAVGLEASRAFLDRHRLRARWDWLRRGLPTMVVATILADIAWVALHSPLDMPSPPLATDPPAAQFHLVASDHYATQWASLPQLGVGVTACGDALAWPVPEALWIGDVRQVQLVGQGRILSTSRTPNTVRARVSVKTPSRLLINQTFAPGWTSDTGHVVADQGRLALDLPPGAHDVTIAYAPPELPFTVVASGVGLVACLAVGRGRWRRSPRVAKDADSERALVP